MGNMETGALESVPKRSVGDSQICLNPNCGAPLQKRRLRGSARRYCSARCRKEAWLRKRGVQHWVLKSARASAGYFSGSRSPAIFLESRRFSLLVPS